MNETEQLWSRCLATLEVNSATLLSQSIHDPFRRVYIVNEHVYKLVAWQHETSGKLRQQDLAGELDILRHCAGVRGIPSVTDYVKTEEFEAIVMKRLPGKPMSSLKISLPRLLLILTRLGVILFKLSLRGVSHNDISPINILITSTGSVSLIDFDQSTRTKCVPAFIRQFIGISIGDVKIHSSLFTIIRKYLKRSRRNLSSYISRLLRRLLRLNHDRLIQSLPILPNDANCRLRNMRKAWKIAQVSNASSPSKILAYYSLDVEGYHFPGERPWVDRWNILCSITNYAGKRILELGCNMALLSCYLLKESNIRAALAVDVDAKILKAAEHVSLALGVKPSLKRVDFDDMNDWETQLVDFEPDIVFALSVLNWVERKERFLAFLVTFPIVIFEGHDHVDVESTRLRTVGFQQIDIVATTERGRQIILCQK